MDIMCDQCGKPWGDGGSIDLRINHRMCAACTDEWHKEIEKAAAEDNMEHFIPRKYELVQHLVLLNQLVDEINALKRRVRQLEGR